MEHLDLLSKRHCKTTGRATSADNNLFRRIHASTLRRVESAKRSIYRFTLSMNILFSWALIINSQSAYASGDIRGSKLVTGTEKLIGDVTTWLMILAPVVAGLLIIYFCIRRSAADEMDTKKWNNRIIVAIVSCIGAVLGSATLNVIIGYYK
ncbi:Mbov_0395 family pilin-like conjugal transfer protein [Paenibacillus sp. FSL L8-0499]|uniref:Mbov_0395 family pilin-like conjugal transfer protein n=1 Tax=Paenibacillus sp. FSL L8-0499 TaxID=2975334 RepID=UPI0030F8DA09